MEIIMLNRFFLMAILAAILPIQSYAADVDAANGVCSNNPVANDKYLESLISNLEQRVNNGIKDGSLMPVESSRLSSKISNIRTSYGHVNAKGKWAVGEGKCENVNAEINSLSEGIFRQRHDQEGNVANNINRCSDISEANNGYLNRQISNLEQRVNNGIKDGSLMPVESSRLSSKISSIRTSYGHVNAKGKWVVGEGKCEKVDEEINSLSQDIFKLRHNKKGNIKDSPKAKAATDTKK
jgi:hypothetical protein